MNTNPTLTPTSQAAELAEIVEQVITRIKSGDHVDLDVVLHDYPDHVDALRGLLPSVQMMAELSRATPDGLTVQSDGGPPLGELGDFRLIREVGRGGMGIVYEAEQISLCRKVALKVLPFAATMDPKQLQRFKNEALAAASLKHEHIVSVYAVGCERGVHYYAMEFVEGQTLAQFIAELRGERPLTPGSPVPESQATGARETVATAALATKRDKKTHFRHIAKLIADAADALEYAHSFGVVHRDVKPANLMVDGAGKLWVTDFGLARIGTDAGLTMTGDMIGTLRYMSPEAALAKHGLVDHRTDVYSLGATLYELLTLKPAVDGADKGDMLKTIAWDDPTPLRKLDKSIPAELETITLKCLAKEPGERYLAAGEMAADLRHWLDDKPIRAKPPTLRQRAVKWARRRPGLTAAVSLTAGLLLAGAWAWERDKTLAETAALAVAVEADQLRDADRFAEALAVARRAADLLPRFGGDMALRQAVNERVADLQLVIRLEEARFEQTAVTASARGFDYQKAAPLFRQAFLDYGVDVIQGDEEAVVDALRKRSVVSQLAAVVFEWELITTDPAEKSRLVRLAEALDTDPRKFMSRVRRAAGDKDIEGLKRLAAEATADLPPPAVIVRLGMWLTAASAITEAERLLRAGQQRHPADLWVNFALVESLRKMGPTYAADAVRFSSAMLALRPLCPGGWRVLGVVLSEAGRPKDAEAAYRRAIALKPDYAEAYKNLGSLFLQANLLPQAVGAFRRATELSPRDGGYQLGLGTCLMLTGHLSEAEAVVRRLLTQRPNYAWAHLALGQVLVRADRPADAVEAHRRATELTPTEPLFHLALADSLKDAGQLTKAEESFRRAITLKPNDAVAHCSLGDILKDSNRPAQAEECYRRTIRLKPDYAEAHCNLGQVLLQQGHFSEALAELRLGHDLGRKEPGWDYPSEQLVRKAEQWVALEPKLPALLSGEAKAADAAELIALAQMCQECKKLYVAATSFFSEAFAAGPTLAEELNSHRYNAACAAALAGCGQGNDAENLDDTGRVQLRRQARDWLTAEFAAWTELAEKPADRPKVRQVMHQWQKDTDLAGIRDAAALTKLPDAERVAWQKLWADVAELLKRTEEPKAAAPLTDKPSP